MKIGIFDSGFGGLEILKEIVKELPHYHYVYLGDSKNAPYGDKKQKQIYSFTKKAVEFLLKKDCSLIVLACNTASSEALRKIQKEYTKVLGVLIPAVEQAIFLTKNKRIGIIATKSTVESKSFVRELKKLDENIEVFQKALPLLVPKIEKREKITKAYLKKSLAPLIEKNIDTLILGCTHYGLIEKEIKEITNINIISEGKVIAKKLKDYLKRHSEIKLEKRSEISFLTTGSVTEFERLGSKFFTEKIKAKKIYL